MPTGGRVGHDQSKVEDVTFLGDLTSEDLFRGDPGCGPEEGSGLGESGLVRDDTDAEVEDLGTVWSEHDVRRFEVPVGDAGGVDGFECFEKPLCGEPQHRSGERTISLNFRLECFALDQLHDEIRVGAFGDDVVDLDVPFAAYTR